MNWINQTPLEVQIDWSIFHGCKSPLGRNGLHMRQVMRKRVFGGVQPGKTQTGLLGYID